MPTGIYERKPRIQRASTCHPSKKHFARGLCRSCYWKNYWKTHTRARGPNKKSADRKYYVENRRSILNKMRGYYTNNKEKIIRYAATYQKEHPEKHAEYTAKYQKSHKEEYSAYYNVRKTRKTQAGGSFTAKAWLDLCKCYGNKCLRCNRRRKLTADHVIPVSKGGTSNIDNIQPLCGPCNSSKGAKSTDYRE